MPRSLPLDLFLFILSTCCITVLDIPGFINRTAFFGRETKLSKVDMINCFYFVSFVSSPCFSFFFPSFFLFHLSTSRAQLFEICTALMVGYSDFLDGDHMLAACFHDSSIGLVRCVHQ